MRPNKLFFFLLLSIVSSSSFAQNEFITTWKTDNIGTSASTEITIPTLGVGYNYDVDWDNDGTFDEFGLTGDVTHDFGAVGTYTIRIQGDFPRIHFSNAGDRLKLLDVSQWGTIAWTNFANAFFGCDNLVISAADAPDLSGVSSFANIFRNAQFFNSNINHWDVSTITSLNGAFRDCPNYNQPLNLWDVSSVTSLRFTFAASYLFNQDLSSWDVFNVTNMEFTFTNSSAFNQSLASWDVSNVTLMDDMLNSSGLSIENYDATLNAWNALTLQPNVIFGAATVQYCQALGARSNMISSDGWTINDGGIACAGQEFITTWKTDNTGISTSTEITIPTNGGGYNYHVDWDNDGTFDEFNLTGNVTHDFGTAGTYTIRIIGDFPRIHFNNGGDRNKILSVDQWGTINWTNFANAFHGCSNLVVTASDVPDLSNVTSLDNTFRSSNINTGLESWNVNTITSMTHTFWNAASFNGDITGWDVSNVTTFERMFRNSPFNQSIGVWNTSSATNMNEMFRDASIFDQNISSWNVTSLTSAVDMFRNVTLSTFYYDALLNGWNAQLLQSGVTFSGGNSQFCASAPERSNMISSDGWTITDGGSFCPNYEFITTWKTDNPGTSSSTEITIPTTGGGYNYHVDWDNDGLIDEYNITGTITHDFGAAGTYTIRIIGDFPRIYFFDGGDKLKLIDIQQWGDISWASMQMAFNGCANMDMSATDTPDLSGVTNMAYAFRGCSSFNGDVSAWNTSTITSLNSTFYQAVSFSGDPSGWDVSNVDNMYQTFASTQMNADLSGWNTGNVTIMRFTFFNNALFNQDIGGWNTSNVTSMESMFEGATSFDQNLGSWDVSNLTDATDMFLNVTLSTANYDALLIGWDSQTLQTGVSFSGGNSLYCSGLSSRTQMINNDSWTITDAGMSCPGEEFITTWKTDNPGTSSSTEITIPTTGGGYNYHVDWDNDGLIDEYNISGTITHDFGTAGTYTIRILGDFPHIYFDNGGDRLKLMDIQQWGTIAWTSMQRAFRGCANMDMSAADAPDLSGVTNMAYTFHGCNSFNGDVSAWNTSNITSLNSTFLLAGSFSGDLSGWDVSNVTTMLSTFEGTNMNSDIGGWNTGNVTNMRSMFTNNNVFNQDIGGWNTSSVTTMYEMFDYATSFDQDLGAWDVSNVTDASGMFLNVTLSVANYDALLLGWSSQTLQTGVSFSGGNSLYCAGLAGRTQMISTDLWTITDGGLSCPGEEFITTWKTDNPGTSSSTEITIPTTGGGYNYHVDWDNDGVIDEYNITGDITHDFGTAGTYTIRILGDFPRIYFDFSGDRRKLLDIEQWGNIQWTSMQKAFRGCVNMNMSATDVPDLSGVDNLAYAFDNCTVFNGDMSAWNTSNINTLNSTFLNAASFSGDLSTWDVSNVTNMYQTFAATQMNADLSGWNTGNVTIMRFTFFNNTVFNQDIGSWNTNNVTSMESMFEGATSFDQNLDTWDVSNVTDGTDMFLNVTLSTANYDALLIGWNSQVLQTGVPFSGGNSMYCSAFSERIEMTDLDGWIITDGGTACANFEFITTWKSDNPGTSTSTEIKIPTLGAGYNYHVDWDNDGTYDQFNVSGNVTHDYGVAGNYTIRIVGDFPTIYFNGGGEKEKILSIDQWGDIKWADFNHSFTGCSNLIISATDAPDLSSVMDFGYAFSGCMNLVGDISSWDVSNVNTFFFAFNGCGSFDSDLNSWNTSNVTTMVGMFRNCSSFNKPIGAWDVSNVDNMRRMFYSAGLFDQDLSTWNTGMVTNMEEMFYGCVNFDQNIGSWDVTSLYSATDMFQLATLSIPNYDALLIGWNSQVLQPGVTFSGGSSMFCAAGPDRANMIASDSWTITDAGMQSTPPVPDLITLPDVNASCDVTSLTPPTASDECAISITVTNDAVFPITEGTTLVTWTYDDGHGNTSTQTQNVIVDDIAAPTAVCQNISIYLNGAGTATIVAADIDGGSTDNCSGVALSASQTVFTCADLGPNNVTLTVTDGNNNSSNCVAVVTVIDTISPAVTCPGNQIGVPTSSCQYTLPDYTSMATAGDNCTTTPTISQSPVAGTAVGLGTTSVTLTADDGNGNTVSCTFDVTVNSSITGVQNETVCNGGSIDVNGTTYDGGNPTGIETFTAANGCDSTVTVTVTELPALTGVQNETVCDRGSIMVNGTIYDAGNLTGTEVFTNVGPNNCDSTVIVTLTILPELTGAQNETVCDGGSIVVNGTTYDAGNLTGTEVFTNVGPNNCDSTVTVTLTIEPAIDATVDNTLMPMLTANQTGATYQWVDCDNGNAPIPLATSQSYTATLNGNYAVEVTVGSCMVTSGCEAVTGVGIRETSSSVVSVYPNPTSGLFTISLTNSKEAVSYMVTTLEGRIVKQVSNVTLKNIEVDLTDESKGVYFLRITEGNSNNTYKIVKQ